ncbi:hypothetical protein Hanom_Chr09g00852911 [Helianthus anomalus]
MKPCVIVIDKDLALMNACARLFPNVSHSLSRWHIQENIVRHCKPSFKTEIEWDKFLYKWEMLINSTTVDDYNYWYDRIRERLPRKKRDDIMDYLLSN